MNKKMDYIDLLLIHEPTGDVHEIYRAMETAYQDGKLRAIGVSNFLESRYSDLIKHCKVRSCTNRLKPFQQGMKSSNKTNGLSRTDRYLVIFGKTAGIVEPCQDA